MNQTKEEKERIYHKLDLAYNLFFVGFALMIVSIIICSWTNMFFIPLIVGGGLVIGPPMYWCLFRV